jgi:hypothetical protein
VLNQIIINGMASNNDNKEIARELAKIASNTAGNLFFGFIMVVVVFGVLLTGFELLLRLIW